VPTQGSPAAEARSVMRHDRNNKSKTRRGTVGTQDVVAPARGWIVSLVHSSQAVTGASRSVVPG
jgi:hypothetical protein